MHILPRCHTPTWLITILSKLNIPRSGENCYFGMVMMTTTGDMTMTTLADMTTTVGFSTVFVTQSAGHFHLDAHARMSLVQ
jgi:hypothetical protein